jgi:hypothetical protein
VDPKRLRRPRRFAIDARRPRVKPPFFVGPLGDSSTVEQRTLTPSILVRIQVPQPNKINNLWTIRISLGTLQAPSHIREVESLSVLGRPAESGIALPVPRGLKVRARCASGQFLEPLLELGTGPKLG